MHAQTTHVFVPCILDADGALNCEQRPERRTFKYMASWGVARELILLGMDQVDIVELAHTRHEASSVLVVPGRVVALWPWRERRPVPARVPPAPVAALLDAMGPPRPRCPRRGHGDGEDAGVRARAPVVAGYDGGAAQPAILDAGGDAYPAMQEEDALVEYVRAAESGESEHDSDVVPGNAGEFHQEDSDGGFGGARGAPDPLDEPPAPPPVPLPASPPNPDGGVAQPAEEPRHPRACRKEVWGCFALARVYSQGRHTGWGATCNRHFNAGESTACKKQLAFGAEHFSDVDCRRKLKRWLLMGFDVPEDGEESRTLHLKCANLRTLDPLGTEGELDRELEARLG